jgi:hypothetical protein
VFIYSKTWLCLKFRSRCLLYLNWISDLVNIFVSSYFNLNYLYSWILYTVLYIISWKHRCFEVKLRFSLKLYFETILMFDCIHIHVHLYLTYILCTVFVQIKNYIPVHLYTVGEFSNRFPLVLETGKKANLWQAFRACFAAGANICQLKIKF